MSNILTDDLVLPYVVEALDVRGRCARVGDALTTLLGRHDYPEPVARLLGEAFALTTLLGSSLKFDGQFIIQTQSDGPVSLLVVDLRTPADIRAYARYDGDGVAQAIAAGKASPEELLGKGALVMTVDQGKHMQRYQGMVPLEGKSLEDVAHLYFQQSEQIPTLVRLAVAEVLLPDGTRTWRAGGLLAQFLPQSEDRIRQLDLHGGDGDEVSFDRDEDDAWVEAQALIGTLKDHELTDPSISAQDLLYRLFHESGVSAFDPQAVRDHCSCSQSRIVGMLQGMSVQDREASANEDGVVELTCEFCSTEYKVALDAVV